MTCMLDETTLLNNEHTYKRMPVCHELGLPHLIMTLQPLLLSAFDFFDKRSMEEVTIT